MIKCIVSTTINAPTEAIKKYDQMEGWDLIVTGDVKTPSNYSLKRGVYISWEEQQKLYPDFCEVVGPNSWSRGRNIAFLQAVKRGATIIATVDDDNVPLDNWGQEIFVGNEIDTTMCATPTLIFDPLAETNYNHLWHRGFPKECLKERRYAYTKKRIKVLFQENLWVGDPDVSSICRSVHRPYIKPEVPLSTTFPTFTTNKYSPLNTQNSIFHASILSHYMSIPDTGRCDDVVGGFLFQRAFPESSLYGPPTVLSQRNEHDLASDMMDEFFEARIIEFLVKLEESEDKALSMLRPKTRTAIKIFRDYIRILQNQNA